MQPQKTRLKLFFLVCLLPLLNGCAAVGLFSASAPESPQALPFRIRLTGLPTVRSPRRYPKSRTRIRTALNQMGIKVDTAAKTEQGKALSATANDRQIEIEFEAVSCKTTRMRTVSKQGIFFKDRATAGEIIIQTEKVLGLS